MSKICPEPIVLDHKTKMEKEIFAKFNKDEMLTSMYGRASFDEPIFMRMINEMYFRDNGRDFILEDPILDSNGKISDIPFKRLSRYIDKWSKQIKKGINPVEANLNTLSDASTRNPAMSRFNKRLSSTINYERQLRSSYNDDLGRIRDDLQVISKSLISQGKGKYSFIKAEKELNALYDGMAEALHANNHQLASDYKRKINEVIGSPEAAGLIRTFSYMMNNLTVDEISKSNFKSDKYDKRLLEDLSSTVIRAKKMLNEFGNVNVKGLQKAKEVIKKYYTSYSKYENVKMENKIRRLDSEFDRAIKQIKNGLKDGTYMPHYGIEPLINIEKLIDSVDLASITDGEYSTRLIDGLESSLKDVISVAKSRSTDQELLYKENPLEVLESYANNATIFNKKQHLMENYLRFLEEVNPRNADWDEFKSVNDFIATKLLATEGYDDSSKTMRFIASQGSKLQTVGKMGLNLTSALRNSTQVFHYIANRGVVRYYKGQKLLDRNNTYNVGGKSRSIKQIIESLGKETGYFFDNIENIADGTLMNMNGVDKKSIEIVDDGKGNPVIKYKRDGVWEKFDRFTAKMTGKSLYFHQKTENWIRSNVYENAFALYFDKMNSDSRYISGYMKKHNITDRSKAEDKIIKDAHQTALNWVQLTQFEYGKQDRPELMGGGISNKSLLGNVAFQFMIYPINMFNMNKTIFREGFESIIDKDYKSAKVGAMARTMGFHVMLGLAGILFNNEFGYLIENETFSRVEKLYEFATSEEPEKINFEGGLVSMFTGPAIQDALFYAEAAGADWSDSEIAQMALGYYDYSKKTDDEKLRSVLQRNAGALQDLMQFGENLQSGDMATIIRNQFMMYPSKRTRDGHKALMSALGMEKEKENKKKKSQNLTDQQRQELIMALQKSKQINQTVSY